MSLYLLLIAIWSGEPGGDNLSPFERKGFACLLCVGDNVRRCHRVFVCRRANDALFSRAAVASMQPSAGNLERPGTTRLPAHARCADATTNCLLLPHAKYRQVHSEIGFFAEPG